MGFIFSDRFKIFDDYVSNLDFEVLVDESKKE